MSERNYAEILYGGTAPSGSLSDNTPDPTAPADQGKGKSNAELAEALYSNHGGSVAESGNIETALGGVFDHLEYQARYEGKKGLAAEIAAVRTALHGNMQALGFSQNSAREVATLIGEYRSSPRDDEEAEKNLDSALDQLSGEWDAEYPQMIASAMQVIRELTKGNPALASFVYSTGLARDVRFLRLAGNIAKGRKATGKK